MPRATEPLRHELRIAAPPEVVFAYFTDPVRMVGWMGVGAQLDPRPGGALRIEANGRDVVVGEYVELDPPRRVVFTWGFDTDERAIAAGSTRVEVVLEPDGDQGTRLTLSHHDLPAAARDAHEQGWNHYLARLGRAAAGDPPGRDPWLVTD
ncbi:MAG: SRPBCC family protein [Solirubrobacteraceae bacterium]